ncbi:hypothetical protein BaRGS_00033602 [Batillaria attramentaria]|uniref:Protein kinase domain-containing protein n=1 Tax=Batillaria attramentaria TaxID=370345 RepID=A0ABD0JKL4_9CAEN
MSPFFTLTLCGHWFSQRWCLRGEKVKEVDAVHQEVRVQFMARQGPLVYWDRLDESWETFQSFQDNSRRRRHKDGDSESDDGNSKKQEEGKSAENPFPRDSHVDVASTLYGKASYTSHGFARYTVNEILGKGHYGMVFLALNENSGKTYAVKVMKKKVRNINKYAYIEEAVLRLSRTCNFIIHLYSSFQTKHSYYLVMEYAQGGNLKQLLDTYGCLNVDSARYHPFNVDSARYHPFNIDSARDHPFNVDSARYHPFNVDSARYHPFNVDSARFLIAEMILGLEFLHANGVIHRDLKIQNILLTLEYHVRLIDFGLSKMGIHGDETTNSGCGTPFYMAPEILRRIAYGNEVDWWALGVVLYKIVTGTFPFMGKTNPEVFVAVTRDRPYYDPHLPSDLVAFFKGVLQKHPAKRLGFGKDGVHQIKSHLFFECINWEALRKQEVTPPPFDTSPETSQTLAGPKKGGSGRTKVRTTRRLSGSVPDVKEVLDMKDEKYKDTILNPRDSKSAQSWSPSGLRPDTALSKATMGAVGHTVTQSSAPNQAEKEKREQQLLEHYPFLPTEPAMSPHGSPKEFVLKNDTVNDNASAV